MSIIQFAFLSSFKNSSRFVKGLDRGRGCKCKNLRIMKLPTVILSQTTGQHEFYCNKISLLFINWNCVFSLSLMILIKSYLDWSLSEKAFICFHYTHLKTWYSSYEYLENDSHHWLKSAILRRKLPKDQTKYTASRLHQVGQISVFGL